MKIRIEAKTGIAGGALVIFGLLVPYFVTTVQNSTASDGPQQPSLVDYALSTALKYKQDITTTGLGFIAIAVFLYIIRKWLRSIWNEYVRPVLNEYKRQIETSTQEAATSVSRLSEQLGNSIRENNLGLAITHASPETILHFLPELHNKIYGEHCSKEKGLYTHLNKSIGKFLDPMIPHRSGNHQEIKISLENEKIKWIEKSKFFLHTIALDPEFSTPCDDREIKDYEFSYKVNALYEDIENLSFKIEAEGESIISTEGIVTLEDGKYISKNPEMVEIEDQTGDELYIHIKCKIPIKKAMTEIVIKEESYLNVSDRHFLTKKSEPSYGSTTSIMLPEGWSFDYVHVFNNEWDVTRLSDNTLTVRNTGWVMPGIILCCAWNMK
ncbi:MAG: hypothetical protein LRY66_16725 [Saccharospirillaceae bacterium]|nr:hypothetical protein [Saccharospirillaceae bacterium]MCD8532949.1 hypothetical protein [Saccharospirillaceae bacterium]